MINDINKSVIDVVKYYDFFEYAPSRDEIYTFLSVKTSKKELYRVLDKIIIKKRLMLYNFGSIKFIYTLPGHGIFAKKKPHRIFITAKKTAHIARFIQMIWHIPYLQLVGYSGSIAMRHAKKHDDIDLFIITGKGRIWTARLIVVLTALLFGHKRKRGVSSAKDKVCVNLLFDERDMLIPLNKRNMYVAHEVLQMRPVIARGDIYERFLNANEWVYEFFPNAKIIITKIQETRNKQIPKTKFQNCIQLVLHVTYYILHIIGNIIELILKILQLFLINQHKTTEIVTNTQLWFFPQDFEKKLRKSRLV